MKIKTFWLIIDIAGFGLALVSLGLLNVETRIEEALAVALVISISISRLKKLSKRE